MVDNNAQNIDERILKAVYKLFIVSNFDSCLVIFQQNIYTGFCVIRFFDIITFWSTFYEGL